MNESLIRDIITPCLIPDYCTINLTGVQVNTDIIQYLVNKMDEHYYNKLIIDFVILDDHHIQFIHKLLQSSTIQKYIFYSPEFTYPYIESSNVYVIDLMKSRIYL